jgi:putative two-component system response regulator
MQCLARAAEYRDDDSGQHVIRVGRYAALIAEQLGCAPVYVSMLEQAAHLHDVGKIGVPDTLLSKKGKLDPSEFERMKLHCEIGKRIIQPTNDGKWNQLRRNMVRANVLSTASSPMMTLAATIALTHHERWDGSGYPGGLAGEEIPLEGRITAIADVFDALSNERPYKDALPMQDCLNILEEGRGTHFDPHILDAFLACLNKVLEVKAAFADNRSLKSSQ